jgi:ABC-type bacteriocin/lantibiotic exporter with double-glycine peptidase domain
MGIASTTWLVLSRTSRQTRAWVLAVLVLEVLGRALLVTAAVTVGTASAVRTVEVGIAAAVAFAATRAAQAFARVRVQRDVYAMTSRAVLTTDVLRVPTSDVRRVALDGTYYATLLVGQLVPSFFADALTSIGIVPLLVTTFSSRVLVLVAIAVGATMGAAGVLRSFAETFERRTAEAWSATIDTLVSGIENRVEIVARAGEDDFGRAFDAQLEGYEAQVRRSGLAGALLGKAPLAAGAVAVMLVVAVDAASKSALEGAVLTQALVLVACFPPVRGAILGVLGMLRSLVYVRPLVELLQAPLRHDVASPGSGLVDLPAPVRGEQVRFAYEASAPAVLDDCTFEWPAKGPLILTGPNGSGKSTLFKLLLGLRPPTTGRIRFGDREIDALDVRALRRDVAYLPQRPYLGEPYTEVRAAMRFGAPDASEQAMRDALARTGVLGALESHGADPLATPIGELSSGQRQRVALARMLLQDARMILLDEPDANLDRDGVALVVSLVTSLCESGKMVAVAAHTPELAALSPGRLHLERQSQS